VPAFDVVDCRADGGCIGAGTLYFPDKQHGLLRGTLLWRSSDYGATWSYTKLTAVTRSLSIDDVACPRPTVCIGVGTRPVDVSRQAPLGNRPGIIVTSDNGATWKVAR